MDEENPWLKFRVGTCVGVWRPNKKVYEILGVTNSKPNNGHFTDVLEWFEHSCRRDKKNLLILEVWNFRFKEHLKEKQGFIDLGGDNLLKIFV